MKTRFPPPARRGFTLVEILIASMIIVVVAGIILVLYQTVDAVRGTQQEMATGNAALGQAMRTMSRDLSCSYVTAQEGTEFILTASDESNRDSSTLTFCASLRDNLENELEWNHATAIQYYVDDLNYPEPTLLRVSHNLVGPETGLPPVTNELIRNVKLFDIQAYNGKEWQPEWSSIDEEGLPQAAQLAVEVVTGDTTTQRVTKVYIPAGNPHTKKK